MAQAYLWQQRFAPPVQTASVRFPKKIQFNPKCPTVNGCALGAVTNVSTDASAIVSVTSTYKMQGEDCFQFTVSNLLSNSSYTFRMKNASTGKYPSGANQFGQLCRISVSPIVNGYACSTSNVMYTSILPTAPYGVNLTQSNVRWIVPTVPENYGVQTITSYTVRGLENIVVSPASSNLGEWYDVAMSSNGAYQTAIRYLNNNTVNIWTSSNYGNTLSLNSFQITEGGNPVSADMAMNALGDKQFIFAYIGLSGYAISSTDYGRTWGSTPVSIPVGYATSLSVFSNSFSFRTHINMVISYEYLVGGQTSNAFKVIRTNDCNIINSGTITDVGGLKATVVDTAGRIFENVSSSLDTWNNTFTITPIRRLNSIASSYDGKYRTAVGDGGAIWTNSNYSANWSNVSNLSENLRSVKMTASGDYQIAIGSNSSSIFQSVNYGQTWTLSYAIPGTNILIINAAMSSNGEYQSFAGYYGGLFTNPTTDENFPITDTRLTISGNQISISTSSYYSTRRAIIRATNMAGSGPFTKQV